jgi:hypothetical protein
MNVDLRVLRPDVREHLQVKVDAQFRMVASLKKHLDTSLGRKFIELLVDLLETEHVVILIPFSSIEGTEFAIDVADVCVVDVAINNVGDDLGASAIVGAVLESGTSEVGERPELLQGQLVERPGVILRNSLPIEDPIDNVLFGHTGCHDSNFGIVPACCP